jgi:TonB family protein
MSRVWIVGLLGTLGIAYACAQDAARPELSPRTQTATSAAEIVDLGPDVTAPTLNPKTLPAIEFSNCGQFFHGTVTLSFVVDAEGVPSNIRMLHPLGNDLDHLALLILTADRFKPGTRNGIPVAVREAANINLRACVITRDESGKPTQRIGINAQPEQSFGEIPKATENFSAKERLARSVSPPLPLNTVEAQYTDEARKARINGVCTVTLIVDTNGFPQNPRVVKSLGHGLDEKALEAVKHYRFKPAMKDGHPFPAMISVDVNFRLY